MAIKKSDLLNRLPSAAELLEKPPIRALADRWNRSVVAGGVRSFLQELQNDVRRRAADIPLPSIRELAERAARYVIWQQQHSLGAAINATGRVWDAAWAQAPLSDAALERALAVGREFVVDPPSDCRPLLCRLVGAQSAAVVHSYAAGVWLALASLAADRQVLISRAEIGDVARDEPLPTLARAAGVRLQEVGTTNRAVAADYAAAASPTVAALLTLHPDAYRVVGETTTAALEELAALAREHKLVSIAALGAAPLIDLPAMQEWPERLPRALSAALASGVDVAVVRGDGLVGGPPCGIIAGNRQSVERIAGHPLFAALRLDALRSAALLSVLECYDTSSEAPIELPVWQLLAAPVENLRNRAERLALQLAQAAQIDAAVPVETHSPLSAAAENGAGWPSYGVALSPADGDVQALARRLREGPLPIIGRIESDRLLLDLRTVFPRQDRLLADAFAGPADQQPAGETSA